MGKDLKGKEIGKGLSQRKDGRYQARFVDRFGKRRTIYSNNLREIKRILRDEQYEDDNKVNVSCSGITLDQWFDIWIDTYKNNCRAGTRNDYRVRYKRLGKIVGNIRLVELNSIILQRAINELKTDESRRSTKIVLVDMLECAVNAEVLKKNVAKKLNTVVSHDRNKKEAKVLSEKDQDLFLSYAKGSAHYNEFALALETGMRIGEILGLKWENVDFQGRMIHVTGTISFQRVDNKKNPLYGKTLVSISKPKTETSDRMIPMSLRAYHILKNQKAKKDEILSMGYEPDIGFEDLVFVSCKNKPIWLSSTTAAMAVICKKLQEDHPEFEKISPHTLRHTFATRCLERGMRPKTLQVILGHSNLAITMDTYCHVVDEQLVEEFSKFENGVKMVSAV